MSMFGPKPETKIVTERPTWKSLMELEINEQVQYNNLRFTRMKGGAILVDNLNKPLEGVFCFNESQLEYEFSIQNRLEQEAKRNKKKEK